MEIREEKLPRHKPSPHAFIDAAMLGNDYVIKTLKRAGVARDNLSQIGDEL